MTADTPTNDSSTAERCECGGRITDEAENGDNFPITLYRGCEDCGEPTPKQPERDAIAAIESMDNHREEIGRSIEQAHKNLEPEQPAAEADLRRQIRLDKYALQRQAFELKASRATVKSLRDALNGTATYMKKGLGICWCTVSEATSNCLNSRCMSAVAALRGTETDAKEGT